MTILPTFFVISIQIGNWNDDLLLWSSNKVAAMDSLR